VDLALALVHRCAVPHRGRDLCGLRRNELAAEDVW
jgi:hypothetical protein